MNFKILKLKTLNFKSFYKLKLKYYLKKETSKVEILFENIFIQYFK